MDLMYCHSTLSSVAMCTVVCGPFSVDTAVDFFLDFGTFKTIEHYFSVTFTLKTFFVWV